jgi:hypothetical protein
LYRFRYFFDRGAGISLLSDNDATRERFNCPVDLQALPLPESIRRRGYFVMAWHFQGHDAPRPVAARGDQPGRSAQRQVAPGRAFLDHEARHAQQLVPEALAQVADDPGPPLAGQRTVAGAVDGAIGQAAAVQSLAVGLAQRQPGQQDGVDFVQSFGLGAPGFRPRPREREGVSDRGPSDSWWRK